MPPISRTRPQAPIATVLICTFNRSGLLDQTLASLARMDVPADLIWDVLVVDNNSADDTPGVVRSHQAAFPVRLRYMHEPRPGNSHALNTGLSAIHTPFVVFTDDDVKVEPNWLAAAIAPMLEEPGISYTGGPVHPMWEAPPPRWLDPEHGDLWGTIAILNYGSSSFVFEERRRIPLGVNMAVRRSLIDAVGGFDPALGRTGTSLLGQAQAEFFYRTRAHGAQGLYVPGMALNHHVPAARLTRRYFRRWWFWKGISRARLLRRHPDCDGQIDMRRVRRIARVPGYVWTSLVRHALHALSDTTRRRAIAAARHEMMLAYYVGFAWEEMRHHANGFATDGSTNNVVREEAASGPAQG